MILYNVFPSYSDFHSYPALRAFPSSRPEAAFCRWLISAGAVIIPDSKYITPYCDVVAGNARSHQDIVEYEEGRIDAVGALGRPFILASSDRTGLQHFRIRSGDSPRYLALSGTVK